MFWVLFPADVPHVHCPLVTFRYDGVDCFVAEVRDVWRDAGGANVGARKEPQLLVGAGIV